MTRRLKLALGVALAAFAVCHLAAAYTLETSAGRQPPDAMTLRGD